MFVNIVIKISKIHTLLYKDWCISVFLVIFTNNVKEKERVCLKGNDKKLLRSDILEWGNWSSLTTVSVLRMGYLK